MGTLKQKVTLRRTTPIRRKTRLRAKGKSSYARRPRDIPYMLAVKRLPCLLGPCTKIRRTAAALFEMLTASTPCGGVIEADHAGDRAYGRKSADRDVIPLCRDHHWERTNYRGAFKDWNAPKMKAWRHLAMNYTRAEMAKKEA